VDTADLEPGYELRNADETWAEIVAVEKVAAKLTAYNLTVAEFQTFYVAANVNAEPVWVHNCSVRLCNNLEAADLPNSTRIRDANGRSITDAHHMVAANSPFAAGARAQLSRFGIDIDDARNGIFLPTNDRVANVTGATVHPRSSAYYTWVDSQFIDVNSRQGALDTIRGVLSRGETPWQ